MRDKAIEEARKSLTYLQKELTKTNIVELQGSIYRLMENQVHRIMLASVREEFGFKVIDPARIPDIDKYVRPNEVLYILVGLAGGLGFGLFTVTLFHSSKRRST